MAKTKKLELSDLIDLGEELDGAAEHSYETKDSSGRFGFYLKEGTQRWTKIPEGEHTITIWPFLLSDEVRKNSPFRNAKNNLNKSDTKIDYKLILLVHPNIGPNRDTIICPNTVGKPCPVHELRSTLDKDADKDLYEALYASKKVLYNVHVLDNEVEKAKGIRIYDASHKFIEKQLQILSFKGRKGMKSDKPIPFYKPFLGYAVGFNREGSGKTTTDYTGVAILQLEDDDRYSDKEVQEILSQVKVLDEIVEILPYDTIKEMVGEMVVSTGSSGKSSSGKGRKVVAAIDDEDESVRQLEDEDDGSEPPFDTKVDDQDIKSLREELGIAEEEVKEDSSGSSEKESALVIPNDCKDCFGKETGEYNECDDCKIYDPCLAQKKMNSRKTKTKKGKK